MEKTNLQVSFDADKLNALRFYMAKKELSVEDELQAHLDRLYEKMVPVQVREYVESQSGSEVPNLEVEAKVDVVKEIKAEGNAPEQEVKADEEKSSEKLPRQSKRQREKELAAVPQPEPQQEQTADGPEEAEEENQGMSMSM